MGPLFSAFFIASAGAACFVLVLLVAHVRFRWSIAALFSAVVVSAFAGGCGIGVVVQIPFLPKNGTLQSLQAILTYLGVVSGLGFTTAILTGWWFSRFASKVR